MNDSRVQHALAETSRLVVLESATQKARGKDNSRLRRIWYDTEHWRVGENRVFHLRHASGLGRSSVSGSGNHQVGSRRVEPVSDSSHGTRLRSDSTDPLLAETFCRRRLRLR
jgi:hypothetical protein